MGKCKLKLKFQSILQIIYVHSYCEESNLFLRPDKTVVRCFNKFITSVTIIDLPINIVKAIPIYVSRVAQPLFKVFQSKTLSFLTGNNETFILARFSTVSRFFVKSTPKIRNDRYFTIIKISRNRIKQSRKRYFKIRDC